MAEMQARESHRPLRPGQVALLVIIALWLAFQVLFPLRHLLYPGSPSWTEEGHRFSWQMKLRDKKANTYFTVRDPDTDRSWEVWPDEGLRSHQMSMQTRPDMILQFAHYIEEVWRRSHGVVDAEVRVHACVSLNGRPAALMIDPQRDLTTISRSLRHADWILPLDVPFERPPNRKVRNGIRC